MLKKIYNFEFYDQWKNFFLVKIKQSKKQMILYKKEGELTATDRRKVQILFRWASVAKQNSLMGSDHQGIWKKI